MEEFYDQLLVIQYSIYDSNKSVQETQKTLKAHECEFTEIKKLLTQIMVKVKTPSPDKVDSQTAQYYKVVVPDNNKYQPL